MAITSFPINTVLPTATIITNTPSGPVTATNVQAAINQLASLVGTGGGTPGGSNLQVQYNNSGSFGGYSNSQVTALLDTFSTSTTTKGVVPGSNGATTSFLRGDGSWASPGGSGTPGGSSGQVQYNNAGSFGGYTGTQVTALLDQFTTALKGVVPASGSATGTKFLRDDNLWAVPPGGGSGTPGGSNLQVQYNNAGAFGGYTNTQVTALLDAFSTSTTTKGVVPGSNGVANTNFLRADGTWAIPPGGGSTSPGGTDGQIQYNNLGVFAGLTMSGDATIATSGVISLNTVAATKGGTGQSFYVTGDILYASAVNAISRLAGNVSATRKWLRQAGNGVTANAPAWDTILAADISGVLTGPSPTIEGAPVIWDNTTGTTLADGQSPVNALAYGADPTGAADSKTAIQAALNTNHLVYLPRGTYKLNSGLSVPQGGGLIGENPGVTVLLRNFTSGDTINVAANIRYFRIENITISRTGAAPISGYGINLNSAGGAQSNDYYEIRNVMIELQFIGLHFGSVNWGYASDITSQSNVSHGFLIDGSPAQVQLSNIIAASNGGDGFHAAGAANAAVGQWRGLSTFTNSGSGLSFTGYAALRLSDSLFGNDAGQGVYINSGDTTHGHVLTNVYTEGLGGTGFYFDSSMSPSVSMHNCCAINNFNSGVVNNSSKNVTIGGGSFIGNGIGGTGGNTYGVLNLAGGKMTVSGVTAVTSGAQTLGIFNSGTICQVIGGQVSTSGTTNTATYS